MKLAVYGLGKLGFPLMNVLTRAGYETWGIDPALDANFQMKWHTEPDVVWESAYRASKEPMPADVSFIVVPTPSLDKGDHRGGFDSAYVETALRQIRNVNKGAEVTILRKPIAVIVSTLSPGTCERLAKQFKTLDIVYNPTFIALGNVVEGLTNPDLLLIGGESASAKGRVTDIWQEVFTHYGSIGSGLQHGRFLHQSSDYTEIELIKLSVNAALGTKISLANSLGQLFKAYGVDPKAVEIVGKDPRIGSAYFKPGGPISGPCLPRDNIALQHAATKVGIHLPLAQATDRVNHLLLDSFYNKVMELKPKSVGILGMSYKYGSDVTDAAPGPWLRWRILRETVDKDPVICRTHDDTLGGDDLEDVIACDVIVTTQPEYKGRMEGKLVINLW